MENAVSNAPRIDELVSLAEYRSKVLPTQGSVEWAVRMHRAEYAGAGALFKIADRLLVHPATFERVTLEIGARKAGAPLDRPARKRARRS